MYKFMISSSQSWKKLKHDSSCYVGEHLSGMTVLPVIENSHSIRFQDAALGECVFANTGRLVNSS